MQPPKQTPFIFAAQVERAEVHDRSRGPASVRQESRKRRFAVERAAKFKTVRVDASLEAAHRLTAPLDFGFRLHNVSHGRIV